ncbi:MAG TPA: M28 family metallopeptidase [Puia sp.]|jgi:Zn-dependent M28 family amino/carboxypeptidase|nr:M28 family metallopeptidase [Puia sp.]
MTSFAFRAGLFLAIVCPFLSCNQGGNAVSADAGLNAFNKDTLASDIKTLSSDDFQGRRPFTPGEAKTIDFLVNTYSRLGLEPGNGNSYTQDVPLVEISPVSPSTLDVRSPKGVISLRNMTDFVCWTERPDSVDAVDKSDIVFAGFGIVAPEYNWNDYAGLDVKGKTVIVMVNDPGFYDSTLFKGHTMTYYGRWTYKYEEAARQGAKACLIIHNTAAASYPFSVVQSSNGGVKLHLDTRSNPSYQLALQGWITEDAGKQLLAAAGKDSSLLKNAQVRGFKAAPLGLSLSGSVRVKEVYNMSHNVIAKITGSKFPNEYVIYSAHWDHLGIGKPDVRGDSIYNGAADNASGTASLLQIARAFKSLPEKPERTVIFLSVTAEEQGLLGSAWYAQHPVYPLATTVADLNIDVINTYGPTKDITYSGKGQSTLEDLLAEEAKGKGRYVAPEDHPEAGHYFRSDHFNFARAGVPSLTADGGVDDVAKGVVYGKQKHDDYTANRYHQPSDQYDSTWNLDGGMQDIQLDYVIGRKLAFSHDWPQWKTGSEFKADRDKTSAERP